MVVMGGVWWGDAALSSYFSAHPCSDGQPSLPYPSSWRGEHPPGQGSSSPWDELAESSSVTVRAQLGTEAPGHQTRCSPLAPCGGVVIAVCFVAAFASDIQTWRGEMTAICVLLTPREYSDIAVKMRLLPRS